MANWQPKSTGAFDFTTFADVFALLDDLANAGFVAQAKQLATDVLDKNWLSVEADFNQLSTLLVGNPQLLAAIVKVAADLGLDLATTSKG